MGTVATKSSRTVLQREAQIYLTTLHLEHDVVQLVRGWFEDGAPLGLTLSTFKTLLRLDDSTDVGAEELFQLFDTDGNEKVDAMEVLSAAVLLAEGAAMAKVDALFPVFDFSGEGRYSFDELSILLHCVCRGLAKVCGEVAGVGEEQVVAECRQLFDAHNLAYTGVITRDQVKRWVCSDIEAAAFMQGLERIMALPELEAHLAQAEEAQATLFSQFCGAGAAARAQELLTSSALGQSWGLSASGLASVVTSISEADGLVAPGRFSLAARALNAFNALDIACQGWVAERDLALLLRLRDHEESADTDTDGVDERLRAAVVSEGKVLRDRWLAQSLSEE